MKKKLLLFLIIFLSLVPTLGDKVDHDLNEIKKKLKEAQSSLQYKETNKKNIEKQLSLINAELESYVKQTAKTNLEIKKNQNEVSLIQQQIQTKVSEIDTMKNRVAELLNYQYKHQFPNVLVLMMRNSDPNKKNRHLEYLKYIQSAQKKSISSLGEEKQKLDTLEKKLQQRSHELFQLIHQQKKLVEQITLKKKQQLKLKQSVEVAIKQEKSNIKLLQASENKLNQLIQEIAAQQKQKEQRLKEKVLKEQKIRGQKLKEKKEQFIQLVKRPTLTVHRVTKKTESDSSKSSQSVTGNLTKEDFKITESGRATIIDSSESLTDSPFSKQKGHLDLPVRNGTVVQYYGQKRNDGGIVKGFVIKSPRNISVFSVGTGTVVYQGMMQDYGNTVIIMHDKAYVTIYTGLSQVNASKGTKVNSNTIIGKTGTQYNGETGLYFELRENSRPINSKSWFK